MNIEIEDLDTITQRYRTPKVLMRHSLPFKVHVVMDSVHKPHVLLPKTPLVFVTSFMEIQMWFQKTQNQKPQTKHVI